MRVKSLVWARINWLYFCVIFTRVRENLWDWWLGCFLCIVCSVCLVCVAAKCFRGSIFVFCFMGIRLIGPVSLRWLGQFIFWWSWGNYFRRDLVIAASTDSGIRLFFGFSFTWFQWFRLISIFRPSSCWVWWWIERTLFNFWPFRIYTFSWRFPI